MKNAVNLDAIRLGVCYYPEHWPEELWEDDIKRMIVHGIEFIRIGEFAWNKFESREGVFTIDYYDRFLALAHKAGLKVIMGTPTATPPAWLTHKYHQVLNAREDGTLYRHGMRRHYNYNSPIYREFVSRLVEKLAEHYCPHPAIIGWQIDNELNCETDVFYSESDHAAFRVYLKNRFGTIEKLNEAMGTVFWNQTYTSWDEVHLTRPTIHNANNPHLSLEEKRFISQSAISFCKLQADIIRKYAPKGQFITTNGIFGHLDSHEMTESALDFITYDSYPNFAFGEGAAPRKQGSLNDRKSSGRLARVRSISTCFGIMEQQSGAGGWDTRMKQPAPKPGQMKLWTFQSIAHGADMICFFRWRTCWVGTEIYWHGLNDYSNLPNRRLAELDDIKESLKKIRNVAGAVYQAKIAFVKDYDNEWDGEQDQWHGPLDAFSEDGWFAAAQRTHTPMDILFLRKTGASKTTVSDLQKYDLLIYPHATILTEETAAILTAYVSGGGKLIMGARTGYKDEYGRCPMRPMPGFAAGLCGVRVKDYTCLGPGDDPVYAIWEDKQIEAPVFNDILEPEGAQVLAVFKGNYYDGLPALVANDVGRGTAYYFGAGFSAGTAEVFLRKLDIASPFAQWLELPEEVELAVRSKNGRHYCFLMNYMPYSTGVVVRRPMKNLLSGETVSGRVRLEKYGVMVLEYAESTEDQEAR